METSIEFVNHAAVIIKGGDVALLTDPWFNGDAFHKGWNLIHETSREEAVTILKKITHIWISHEHPDHFSVAFFKKYQKEILENAVVVLFQDTKDKRVANFIRSLNIQIIEIEFNQDIALSDSFSINCIKDGFYDSALLVNYMDEKILNLNDCEVSNIRRAQELFLITGKINVLLTQFSYAAWKGGKGNKKWRITAADEKLQTMKLQIDVFTPDVVIPFASFAYFSNVDNFYLNDSTNTPMTVDEYFSDGKTEVLNMKPGDIFGGMHSRISNTQAIEFWNDKRASLGDNLHQYNEFSIQDIYSSFEKYCSRISNKNNIYLIKFLRIATPFGFFNPCSVRLTDLDLTLKFDYVNQYILPTHSEPMISMRSESLKFIFDNGFGFDTLTVNGCFEEEKHNGFISATKSLAIENLNNMGITINWKTLFEIEILKLFFEKVQRVRKRLSLQLPSEVT